MLEPIRLFKFGRTFLCFDFWWIQCYKMWAFWVQLLQFFLENAILKWKLALIQKWIVIFEIVCNEKHGKWYNLLTLLISISQIWTFSCKNLEKIVVYVMPYLKCQPNLKLIIFKLSLCSDYNSILLCMYVKTAAVCPARFTQGNYCVITENAASFRMRFAKKRLFVQPCRMPAAYFICK